MSNATKREHDLYHGFRLSTRFPWVHVPAGCLGLTLLVYLALLASAKPIWFDEFATLNLCNSNIPIRCYFDGSLAELDPQPPLYYLSVRAIRLILGDSLLSLRTPSILGFIFGSFFIYKFTYRCFGVLYGLLAVSALSLSVAFDYGYEARPYGLVLGLAAFALFCWQTAAGHGGRYRWCACVGLSFAISAAILTHLYSVFLVIPLVAGENVRAYQRRKVDWAVVVSIAAGVSSLAVLLPLILRARTLSSTFWSPAEFSQFADYYPSLFSRGLPPVILALFTLPLYVRWRGNRAMDTEAGDLYEFHHHELAAIVVLALLAFIEILFSLIFTGIFVNRYALPTVIGVVLIFVSMTRHYVGRTRTCPAIILIVLCLWFLLIRTREISFKGLETATIKNTIAELDKTAPTLPVVVFDEFTYTKFLYYSPSSLLTRLRIYDDTGGRRQAWFTLLTRHSTYSVKAVTARALSSELESQIYYFAGPVTNNPSAPYSTFFLFITHKSPATDIQFFGNKLPNAMMVVGRRKS